MHIGFSDTPAWVTAKADTSRNAGDGLRFRRCRCPTHLLRRDVERELLPMARSLGLTVAAWGPLAQGALAARTPRHGAPSALSQGERSLVESVRNVAAELDVTTAQVALAWLRSRSDLIHPVVGARTAAQLADSMASSTLTLPEAALRQLTEGSDFSLGFPHDFLGEVEQDVLGAAAIPPGTTLTSTRKPARGFPVSGVENRVVVGSTALATGDHAG
ncbi:aldo/keto reductase [Saccharomonospora xinjiangensis]|uniref:aldo/keto reductase n=1 Tax=Saccharomonospora xinjiangensis TaxID=75294 RepID=UPI000680D799|nr:aldo/keto reductase [Saccharomonospora xinjiangensis]